LRELQLFSFLFAHNFLLQRGRARFATIPAGTEIMIAMEKPKAITTNKTLIFLLETFLNALVKTPTSLTFQMRSKFEPKCRKLLKGFSELDPNPSPSSNSAKQTSVDKTNKE
jgi:hypothetical protein